MKKSRPIFWCFSILFILISFPSYSQLSPVDDVTACLVYTLPPIQGQNLSGDEAYFLQPNGAGNSLQPGDQITESTIIFIQATINGQVEEECFIVNIIENAPRLDTIPDIYACVEYILPKPAGQFLTPYAGYYTQPNGQGPFFSPGTRIDRSLRLYAYDGIPGCESERVFEVFMAERPILLRTRDTLVCDSFILPKIEGFNIPVEAYYVDIINDVVFKQASMINYSTTLEIVADTLECIVRDTFDLFVSDFGYGSIPDTSICIDDNFHFTRLLTKGRNASFNRSGNYVENLSTGAIVSARSNPKESGTFVFVDSLSPNCVYRDTFDLIVSKKLPTFFIKYQNTTFCRNQNYDLKNFVGSTTRYFDFRDYSGSYWFQDSDGNILTDDKIDYRSLRAGTHNYTLHLFDSKACDIKFDTVNFQLTLVDDCLQDTVEVEYCPVRYQSNDRDSFKVLVEGGLLYDSAFNYIGKIFDTGYGLDFWDKKEVYYYIISDPFDNIDTTIVILNQIGPITLEWPNDRSLCRDECFTFYLDPLSIKDSIIALLSYSREINSNLDSIYAALIFNKQTICFKKQPQRDSFVYSDTVYLNVPNTNWKFYFDFRTNGDPWWFYNETGCYTPPTDTFQITTLADTRFLYIDTLCPGTSVTIEDQTFDKDRTNGKFISQTVAHNGCDSIIEVHIDFHQPVESTVEYIFCETDTVFFNCTAFYPGYTSEQQVLSGASQYGCDSTVNLSIIFYEAVEETIEALACPLDPVLILDKSYNVPGIYFDTIRNAQNCDSLRYTIFIQTPDDLIDSLSLNLSCEEDHQLSVEGDFDVVSWSTGESQRTINVQSNQNYLVTVTDGRGCEQSDSIFVEIDLVAPTISGDGIYFVTKGQNFRPQLSIEGNYIDIEWSNIPTIDCSSCINPLMRPEVDQVYWMTVYYGDSCTVEYPIQIILETEFYLPNIIHPDSDQPLNQRLFLQGSNNEVVYELRVFDRWGTTVFKADELMINDSNSGWDGTFDGKKIGQGVYVYSIKYLDQRTGTAGLLSGDILVVH